MDMDMRKTEIDSIAMEIDLTRLVVGKKRGLVASDGDILRGLWRDKVRLGRCRRWTGSGLIKYPRNEKLPE